MLKEKFTTKRTISDAILDLRFFFFFKDFNEVQRFGGGEVIENIPIKVYSKLDTIKPPIGNLP